MLAIGNITLPFPCMLAPMAGVSDLPFRLVTRSFGAPLAFTEMVDVSGLYQMDKRTRHMLSSDPDDRPLGIQLLGNNAEHIVKALRSLEGHAFDLIDLNAACPTPKITRKGKGAALLKDPRALGGLLRVIVEHSTVPVTVKIRAGWDQDSINAPDIARYAEDAGISALFIHGRTRVQGYSGTVDYRVIREVKDAVKMPVIASGDNISIPLIGKMFDETGCDGVAVARGALGNPWIFREVIQFLRDGTRCARPDINERVTVMKAHLDLLFRHYGEKRGVGIFHKFFIWYTRGIPGMKPLRDRAFRTDTKEGLLGAIDELRILGDA